MLPWFRCGELIFSDYLRLDLLLRDSDEPSNSALFRDWLPESLVGPAFADPIHVDIWLRARDPQLFHFRNQRRSF